MNDSLKWFMETVGYLSEEERISADTKNEQDYNVYPDDLNLQDEFFKRMPYCNITSETYGIKFGKCATDLIKELFNEYGNDSLIISTYFEHDNVNKILNEHDNVYKLRYSDDLTNLQKYIKENNYKKVFVYVIATQISNGFVAPTDFLRKLKNMLERIGVQIIFTLDAVQEMFILPRDYSMFDYIIGTGHSLVMSYDVGMLLYNRKNKSFGYAYNDLAKKYLNHLDIILSKKESLLYYKFAMKEMFKDIIDDKFFTVVQDSSPQIFSIRVDKSIELPESFMDKIRKHHIYLDGFDIKDAECSYIRIRWQRFLVQPFEMYKGILLLKEYIKEIREMIDE